MNELRGRLSGKVVFLLLFLQKKKNCLPDRELGRAVRFDPKE
jgi:hypothetical protein